jgi:hypothetical protein
MYTSMLLVALAGMAPSVEGSKAPAWSLDYTAASDVAAKEKKPLAVFLAPGQGAYEKIGQGGLGAESQGLLAEKYVCVHIDTSTSKGKALAQAFEMPQGLGIVISDRTLEKQAFRHEGDLAKADLVRYLQHYAEPNRVFAGTESNPDHVRRTASAFQQSGYFSSRSC